MLSRAFGIIRIHLCLKVRQSCKYHFITDMHILSASCQELLRAVYKALKSQKNSFGYCLYRLQEVICSKENNF